MRPRILHPAAVLLYSLTLLPWVFAPNAPGGTPYEAPAAEVRPQNQIDQLVLARLQSLNITPAHVCSDAVFVRRVYLDIIGTLPTGTEAQQFILDRNPDSRSQLIDRLLARDEFADYLAMKWGDVLRIKAEFPIDLWPNAAQSYHHWLYESIDNKPCDRFARDLLVSSGSNFEAPPVNFYRAMQNRTPPGIARSVALTFMGERATLALQPTREPGCRFCQMSATNPPRNGRKRSSFSILPQRTPGRLAGRRAWPFCQTARPPCSRRKRILGPSSPTGS